MAQRGRGKVGVCGQVVNWVMWGLSACIYSHDPVSIVYYHLYQFTHPAR